jgi:hypothetical protein
MYPGVIRMINSRPLTLSSHPNVKEVCKQMGKEPGVITPFQLHFGLRYYCAPLFGKGGLLEVNGNNLKPYAYSDLYSLLPPEIKILLGENMSPE